MFLGNRRRPLLATAVVVGASRSAARHEVARQSDSQQAADRLQCDNDERNRRDEEERDRRTQRAIDDAIARERVMNRSPLPEHAVGLPGRDSPSYAGLAAGPQLRPGYYAEPSMDPPGPPPYEHSPRGGVQTPTDMAASFCNGCGRQRASQDRFCAGCGCKLPLADHRVLAGAAGGIA